MPTPEDVRKAVGQRRLRSEPPVAPQQAVVYEGSRKPPIPEGLDLRNLREIERPHSAEIILRAGGNRLLVDERMVLSYNRSRREFGTFIIDTERTTPVLGPMPAHADDFCVPYEDEEARRGTYTGTFLGLRRGREVAYVGETYKVTFVARDTDAIALLLESTDPITTQPIPPVQGPVASNRSSLF